jgi:hypothetical protein
MLPFFEPLETRLPVANHVLSESAGVPARERFANLKGVLPDDGSSTEG